MKKARIHLMNSRFTCLLLLSPAIEEIKTPGLTALLGWHTALLLLILPPEVNLRRPINRRWLVHVLLYLLRLLTPHMDLRLAVNWRWLVHGLLYLLVDRSGLRRRKYRMVRRSILRNRARSRPPKEGWALNHHRRRCLLVNYHRCHRCGPLDNNGRRLINRLICRHRTVINWVI